MIAGILAVVGLFFVLGVIYKNIFFVRFNSSARLEIKSQTQRVQLLEQSFSLLKKHFLFGTGIGNYTLAVFRQINSHAPSWWYQPVHNTFLLVWVEVGLFGFLFFIALLFYLGFRKYKNKNRFNYSFAFWPLLIALIIMLNFDHWWWSLHFGVLFFWFCLGVLAKD
jgi:O-antigen ligase